MFKPYMMVEIQLEHITHEFGNDLLEEFRVLYETLATSIGLHASLNFFGGEILFLKLSEYDRSQYLEWMQFADPT